jgi:PleD family two-component response regulator
MRVGETSIPVTTSAGAASLMNSDKSGESFIGRADAAVYEAKHTGRNRACGHPSRSISLVSRAS